MKKNIDMPLIADKEYIYLDPDCMQEEWQSFPKYYSEEQRGPEAIHNPKYLKIKLHFCAF